MPSDLIRRQKERLLQVGFVSAEAIKGCPEQDLKALERQIGYALPELYRSFLKAFGNGAGDFLRGSDYICSELIQLQEYMNEFVAELGLPPLPEKTYFAFLCHQGHSLLLLKRSRDAKDPPVFLLSEEEPKFMEAYSTFSSWLQEAVDEDLASAKPKPRGHQFRVLPAGGRPLAPAHM